MNCGENGTRTRTAVAGQQILSLLCLPFHHPPVGGRRIYERLCFFWQVQDILHVVRVPLRTRTPTP